MKRKITAIDVGTAKVCTIMGVLDDKSGLRIMGVGIAPSHGIEKALVANVSQAKESIRQSINKAEMMAGYKLDSAYIGVTGQSISSVNNKGTIAITHTDQLVRQEDMKRVLEVALNAKTPADRKMLHVIPRAYTLDGQQVENPVGMHGYELSVEVHVVTGAAASVQNLTQCIRDVGIGIEDLILEPLASAEAVLNEEEKQSGVLIADIGGGITNIAVMKDGSIYYTSVLPVAGHQITQDIATGLELPFELAEEMKKKYGSLQPLKENEGDKVFSENGHNVSYHDLCEIIRARVEELMRLVMLELPRTDYDSLIPSGIVITGGCANLPGIVEITQVITRLPVRIGVPSTLNGVSSALLKDPAYATSVGLILWKMKNDSAANQNGRQIKPAGIRGFFSSPVKLFR
ncbi:MAG TPA: cell division protein FtsA [Dehalococcoidales bacterium]